MSGGQHPYVYSGGLDCGMNMAHTNPEQCLTRYWTFRKGEVPMAGSSESQGIFALRLYRMDQDGSPACGSGRRRLLRSGARRDGTAALPRSRRREMDGGDEDAAWVPVKRGVGCRGQCLDRGRV